MNKNIENMATVEQDVFDQNSSSCLRFVPLALENFFRGYIEDLESYYKRCAHPLLFETVFYKYRAAKIFYIIITFAK